MSSSPRSSRVWRLPSSWLSMLNIARPRRARASRGPSAAGGHTLQRLLDLAHGVGDRRPAADIHVLAFDLLVDREELLDLLAQRQRQVGVLLVHIPVGIVQRYADDLVVD